MTRARTAAAPPRLAWAMACAALVGFVSLAWEILWIRVHMFASGGTISVFGILLGLYLLGIATGALVARRACAPGAAGSVRRLARTAALLAAGAGAVAYLHTPAAAWVGSRAAVPLMAAVVACVAGGMYGAVLPLVTHCAVAVDARTGRRVSYVYLANIVGSALGSALTGFVALDVLGMAASSAALLALSGVLAAVLLGGAGLRAARGVALAVAGGLAVLALLGPALYGSLWERLLWKAPEARDHPLADVVETRAGVVVVTRGGTVFGTGAYDGRLNVGLDDDRNSVYRAYAAGALHRGPRRVAMLGLGSGSWAQVVSHLPTVEELVVVEINAGYLEILRRYPLVRSLLENPKVSIVVDDGRRWLARAGDERFDMIVANVTLHWRINSSHLLSREFFALAAARLRPDGVLYFNATGSQEAMRTACTVFRSGLRFANFVAVGDGAVRFDPEAFGAVVRATAVDGRPAARDPDAWLAANLPRLVARDHVEPCPRILARTVGVRLVTDDNLATEVAWPWYAYPRAGRPE